MQSKLLFFTKHLLILRPAISMRSFEIGETGFDGGRDGYGRSSVFRHRFDENLRDEFRDFVRERVDEGGDSEDSRVCIAASQSMDEGGREEETNELGREHLDIPRLLLQRRCVAWGS